MTAKELKSLRDALGWTQDRLADELVVHRVTVARWEVCERAIPETAARLARRIHDEQVAKKRCRK